jgi:hypothetical protein
MNTTHPIALALGLLALGFASTAQAQTWTGAEIYASSDWIETSYDSGRSYSIDGSSLLWEGASTTCGGARCLAERTYRMYIPSCGDQFSVALDYTPQLDSRGRFDNDMNIGVGDDTTALMGILGDSGAYITTAFYHADSVLWHGYVVGGHSSSFRSLLEVPTTITMTVDKSAGTTWDVLVEYSIGGSAPVSLSATTSDVPSGELFVELISGDRWEEYLIHAVTVECSDTTTDSDGDGVEDDYDLCPGYDDNADADADGFPDGCDDCPYDAENDADNDGLCAEDDICPGYDDLIDGDGDLVPDGCDACPADADNDADGDGICGDVDVCSLGDDTIDTDGDGTADACDACPDDAENDADGDGFCESDDNCPFVANATQSNVDGDEYGDACEPDNDADGVIDDADNCPLDSNADQADYDGDGVGDVCDADTDGDGVIDADDVCLGTAVGEPVLEDGCSWDQECACEASWKNHGAFTSCVAHATEDLVELGAMTEDEKDAIMSEAGSSSCGHKSKGK